MIHEEAARKIHEGAVEFSPVRNMRRAVIGWIFEIPREDKAAASVDYGWVTVEGEASGDVLANRFRAEANLKAYRSSRNRTPLNTLEKRA